MMYDVYVLIFDLLLFFTFTKVMNKHVKGKAAIFNRQDERLLAPFSAQAAVAIENSRMFTVCVFYS